VKPNLLTLSLLLASSLLFTACAGPRAVVFHTATQVGIEATAIEAGQQAAHVGYRRIEGVVMPLSFQQEEIITKDGQAIRTNRTWRVNTNAYPVLSVFRMTSGSLLLPALNLTNQGGTAPLRLHQVFATGDAAVLASQSGAAVNDFKALSGEIANDADSSALKAWVGTTDKAARTARRQKLAAWIKQRKLDVRVHDLIYEPGNSALRSAFVKDQGGAEALLE
jgi:hypothetical protein